MTEPPTPQPLSAEVQATDMLQAARLHGAKRVQIPAAVLRSLLSGLDAERARVRELEAALEAITGTLDAEVVPAGSVAERVRMLARMYGHAHIRGCERWDGWEQSRSLAADLAEAVRRWVSWCDDWHAGKPHPFDDLVFGRAALARYEQGAPADGWLPIESAPRDRAVDLWIVGEPPYRMPDCTWGRAPHCCGEAGQYCDSDWHRTPDGWIASDGFAVEETATHWRPPPSPPTSAPAPTQQEGKADG